MTLSLKDDEIDNSLAMALSVLTLRVYVQINRKAFNLCKPVAFLSLDNTPSQLRRHPDKEALVTWIPKDSHFFSLMRVGGDSLVYCHSTDTLYAASPHATLADSCPNDVCFLAQFCQDTGDIPRLLVFDIIESPAKPPETSPSKRGEQLRSYAHVLPAPLCTVQWAGWTGPLRTFVSSLPHKAEYFMELTKDPLAVIRMHIW